MLKMMFITSPLLKEPVLSSSQRSTKVLAWVSPMWPILHSSSTDSWPSPFASITSKSTLMSWGSRSSSPCSPLAMSSRRTFCAWKALHQPTQTSISLSRALGHNRQQNALKETPSSQISSSRVRIFSSPSNFEKFGRILKTSSGRSGFVPGSSSSPWIPRTLWSTDMSPGCGPIAGRRSSLGMSRVLPCSSPARWKKTFHAIQACALFIEFGSFQGRERFKRRRLRTPHEVSGSSGVIRILCFSFFSKLCSTLPATFTNFGAVHAKCTCSSNTRPSLDGKGATRKR
mmetsp:Transcript_52318/g.113393  ORF Transcript_52318/g.113393 Transcript_52318/m.113393 type:complete len:286 (-) Transcript_52318:647-1504(-)